MFDLEEDQERVVKALESIARSLEKMTTTICVSEPPTQDLIDEVKRIAKEMNK